MVLRYALYEHAVVILQYSVSDMLDREDGVDFKSD